MGCPSPRHNRRTFEIEAEAHRAFAAPVDARVAFIRRTYLHLAAAIAVFVVLSWAMFVGGIGEGVANWLMSGGRGRWFVILGGFMLVGWLGQAMAHRARSQTAQYAGLTLYTFGEALIFATGERLSEPV